MYSGPSKMIIEVPKVTSAPGTKEEVCSQDFLQDFTFWGAVEGLWGGSSLGPLGVQNKVSKNLGGGTDFGGGSLTPQKTGLQETPGTVN